MILAKTYNSACIHYFSGTGNTSRVAHLIGEGLQRAGCLVHFCNIEHKVDFSGCKECDLLVFAFPVYSFSPPAIMQRYLRVLPRGQRDDGTKAKAAVIAVHGASNTRSFWGSGYEGQASSQASRIIRGRGYDVFLSDAVGYPANLTQLISPPSSQDQEEIIRQGDLKVDGILKRILSGEKSIKGCFLPNLLWSGLVGMVFSLAVHRIGGKLYAADSRCTSCGRCVDGCPVKIIKLWKGRPRWGWNCEACQRCINICPKGAIQTTIPRLMVQLLATFLPYSLGLEFTTGYFQLEMPDLWGSGALIRIAGYLITVYLADLVLYSLESKPLFKGILAMSCTRGFRRYLAPGYDPLEIESPQEPETCKRQR